MDNGIYNDVTIEKYHEDKSHLSATQIKWARNSLAHFKWFMEHEQGDKPHFSFGNAFELALLDKKMFDEKVAVMPTQQWINEANQGREKEYKSPKSSGLYQEKQNEFHEQNKGKYIIMDVGKQSYDDIKMMVKTCDEDETIQKLLGGVQYQLSVYWTDEHSGLNLKTRPDICQVKRNVIVNVKTIIDGSPDSFARELSKHDYPLQACMEIKGTLASGLMSSVDFYYWLVVEKEPPYNATLYEFTIEDQKLVFDDLDFLLMRLKRAKEQNKYPGYTARADNPYGILQARLPPWYKQNF